MSRNQLRKLLRIALVLALALVVCLISGCSRKEEPAAPAETAVPEVTEAPAEEITEAPAEAAAEVPAEKAAEEPAAETAEAPVEAAAEAPAEKAAEESAAETAEAPVEAVAEAPAEKAAEEPAAENAEAPAEAAAEAPAEKAAEEPAAENAEATAEAAAEATAENSAEEPAAEEAAEEQPTEVPAEPVLLATVNGQEIKSDDDYLQSVISYYMDYAANYGYDTTDPDMLNTINQYSMQYTVRTILIRQKAAELGLDQFTDEEKAEMEATLRTEWADTVNRYIEQYNPLSETATDEEKAAARADAEAALLQMGYDEERFVSEFTQGEIDNKITERLRDYLTAGKTVTEEDVQKYFDDLVKEDQENYGKDIGTYEFYTNYYGQSSYYVPEGYRAVTHILLAVDEELLNTWKDLSARLEEQKSAAEEEPTEGEEPTEEAAAETASEETPAPEADAEPTEAPTPTPEPVTQEMVDAAEKAILDSVQSTVDEIKAKLESGTSFEDLIKEYGTDPGMQDDATRAKGYSVHKDSIMWDPIFTATAMALEKVGDISDPVVSQFGVHILQYLKDIPGGAVELTDEMKAEFQSTLVEEMKSEALNTALDQWTAEASIVYTEAGEAWKVPEAEEAGETEEETAEEPAAEEPATEEPAPETPVPEETANP